jgi:hypothetical protein
LFRSNELVFKPPRQPQFVKLIPSQQPESSTLTQLTLETQTPVEDMELPCVTVSTIEAELTVMFVQVRLTPTTFATLPTAGVIVNDAPPELDTEQPVQLALRATVAPTLLAETLIPPLLSAMKEKVVATPDVAVNVAGVRLDTTASAFGVVVAPKKIPTAATNAIGKSLNTRRLFIG